MLVTVSFMTVTAGTLSHTQLKLSVLYTQEMPTVNQLNSPVLQARLPKP